MTNDTRIAIIGRLIRPRRSNPVVELRLVKRSLGTLLREALDARSLPEEIVVDDSIADGAIRYVIHGQRYSPGEAADLLGVVWP